MKNPMSELLARRVPQFLGLYLAGSWAFVEFLDWAVEQFVLSPHITSFVFLLILLLLPTVVILTWRHGAPGPDRWGRMESIGIPLNLLLAATVLYTGFSGKDLGAATTTVTLEDEAGNEIERQVPKQAFRKQVALFFFDNESGDETFDWLSYGTTLALQVDLVCLEMLDHTLERVHGVVVADVVSDIAYRHRFTQPVGDVAHVT